MIASFPFVYFYGRILPLLDFVSESLYFQGEKLSENSDVSQVFLCRQLSL